MLLERFSESLGIFEEKGKSIWSDDLKRDALLLFVLCIQKYKTEKKETTIGPLPKWWLYLSSKCILSSVRVWRFWGWWDGPFPFRKVIEPFGLQHQPFNLLPDSSTAINEKLSSAHHSPPPTPKASAQRYKCTLCTLCKCQAVQCLYGMIDLFHV